ncbi:MAG: serine hydrolase, partial [Phycicoccus sp.]
SQWRLDRWDDRTAWDAGPAVGDVLVQPRRTDKAYMAAYPASLLKLMVGYGVLRLVDRGELSLRQEVRYRTVGSRSCAYGPSNPTGQDPPPQADGATDTLDGWFDAMITVSDNFATCVLLQVLHDRGAIVATNRHFAELGLTTLRMEPSQPDVGNGWSSGRMTMGALDTAKLLLLVNGRGGALWRTPSGRTVTADDLSPSSRRYFLRVLGEQSFHEVLDPVALCGSPDAVPGIPARVPDRWIDPATGHVVTYDGDLTIDFGYDVRPCNAAAEVTFAHKTGLTSNAGSDAGIVRALPGEGGRWYVVAVVSSVGSRFGDPDWATADPNSCEDAPFVCYPRAFGRLGASVDALLSRR